MWCQLCCAVVHYALHTPYVVHMMQTRTWQPCFLILISSPARRRCLYVSPTNQGNIVDGSDMDGKLTNSEII